MFFMKKVFIFDDDKEMLRLYSSALMLSGHEVVTSPDGTDAEQKLLAQDARPDVILLDVMMPKADGFEVLERIKSNESLRAITVVILTNLESLKDAQADLDRARSMGAAEVVIKSQTDPKDVVAIIEALSTTQK